MADTPSFVVNDRRKFTVEGDLRQDAPKTSSPVEQVRSSPPESKAGDIQQSLEVPGSSGPDVAGTTLAELTDSPEVGALSDVGLDDLGSSAGEGSDSTDSFAEDALPPGPTPEQADEAARAYEATTERLDTAMRATNPGGERLPPMNFERLIQSLYTQALILLGGGAQPGETPRVDILGARETIDMLSVLASKSEGNLSSSEDKLLQSALFDLRMGFLEITQALARQAAQRQTAGGPGGFGGGGMNPASGPRIVR